METLREKQWAIAKEYARQFGKLIEIAPEFWVADEPEMCCFGDILCFSHAEMRVVIDNIDRYVKKYGSKKAVGEEIIDWVDWWMDDVQDGIIERILPRVTHQLRPNISLRSWLDGCPRQERKAWSGPDAEYLRLQNYEDTLCKLIEEYRGSRSLDNVLENVRAQLSIEAKKKEKRDKREYKHLNFLKKDES